MEKLYVEGIKGEEGRSERVLRGVGKRVIKRKV